MKKIILFGAMLGATCSATAANDTAKEWAVDYSGKPPFKRTLVELDVIDVAQAEPVETTMVVTTDFSGKPPFKRNVEQLQIIDAAQLEPANAGSTKVRRGKPPFKR